jgi:hypothetical protein
LPDLNAAIEWAKRCPAAQGGGSVEIRPVVVFTPEQFSGASYNTPDREIERIARESYGKLVALLTAEFRFRDLSGERLLGGVASNRNWMADEASEWHCDSEGEMLTRMAWQAKTWQHIGAFLPVFKRGSGVLRSLV